MVKVFNKSQNVILNSKQRILKTASNLFSEFGFLGVSMMDIAKRLNVTKASLYYHFGSKKEIYLKVLSSSYQDLMKIINRGTARVKSPRQKLVQLVQGYLEFGLKEKNLIRSLTLKFPNMDPEIKSYVVKLRKDINHQFQSFLKDTFRNKKITRKANPEFVASLLLGLMDELILEATLFNKKIDIKKRTSQILEIVKSV